MASEIENRLEHKERALLYADSACMVEATTGNNYKMAVRQTQKASILVSMERYEEAEKMLAEVVPYFREAGDQLSLAIALNKRGQAARYLGHLDDAVEYLSESIEICQRIGNPYNEAYAQRAIYEILYKSNPDAARMHLERYHLLKDSLYSGEREGATHPQKPPPRRYWSCGCRGRDPLCPRLAHLVPTPPEQDQRTAEYRHDGAQ